MTGRSLRRACAGLLFSAVLGTAHAAVRAWVDSNSIAPDATVQLTIEHDGQSSEEPDLEPLKQDFDILTSSRGTSMQIINGSVSSHVQLQLSLAPKHSGEIRIPAITWGAEHSDPLTVTVADGAASRAAGGAASAGPVFVEAAIDTRQPYVQAAVKLKVRLYSKVPLFHATLELPANNDVLIQQLGADRTETEVRKGERYQVIERDYEVFPQRSGPLTLPAPVLDAQMPVQDRANPFGDSFFGNMMPLNGMLSSSKPIRVRGEAIELNVLPRPADAGADYWLPARSVSLEGDWHPSEAQANVGDPVTLDLHLQAHGLTAAQLPDLGTLLQLPAGLKAYPDQAKLTNDTQGDTVVGRRDQSIALIADQPGRFTIPALKIRWWDTQSNQAREAILPERTLRIAPGATSTASQAATGAGAPLAAAGADANESRTAAAAPAGGGPALGGADRWRWVSLALAVVWVMTLLAWYVLSRRKGRPPSAAPRAPAEELPRSISGARARFQDACRRSDARAARAALVAWIEAARPQATPVGLRAFARLTRDAKLSTLLEELDRACYAGAGWNGAALLEALHELPPRIDGQQKPDAALLPLYR